jgi:hypothetical protein
LACHCRSFRLRCPLLPHPLTNATLFFTAVHFCADRAPWCAHGRFLGIGWAMVGLCFASEMPNDWASISAGFRVCLAV